MNFMLVYVRQGPLSSRFASEYMPGNVRMEIFTVQFNLWHLAEAHRGPFSFQCILLIKTTFTATFPKGQLLYDGRIFFTASIP